jgi:two-component sensor histidine kinase
METATLLVSEIVSNAIRYGAPDGPIWVTCSVEGQSLHCVVRNRGPRVDLHRGRHSGYGLELVAALSRGWGTRPTDDGIQVWFQV